MSSPATHTADHYQSKYLAHLLSLRYASDSGDKFAATVAGAQVDMNPHQVEAALFAFKSPFSNGAILADEVGLGKTIEAGILLSQKWAQHHRKILIIVPSNLRKQWMQELAEKFFLPSTILEAKNFNKALKNGSSNPFLLETESIIICSYHFARNKDEYLAKVPWDLVVIDEAHRLRNVYKKNNVIANKIKIALKGRPKVLLTATPLQNSLQELFGLVSFIDEHAFGNLTSFKQQFSNLANDDAFSALKQRLAPLCHRTLRRQVNQYVSYTARHAMIEEFLPESDEDQLYDIVSDYLQRPEIQALPAGQRSLMTLILRKLLASSTFAIAGALRTMSNRLSKTLELEEKRESIQHSLTQDFEGIDAELLEDDTDDEPPLSPEELEALSEEAIELSAFAELAEGITENGKGKALLRALHTAIPRVTSLGGAEKALIFTESRRTQDYLCELLATTEWADSIVMFNGSNTDQKSKEIYAAWLERHKDSDKFTGSRTADMRSALVDYFREEGKIMIATEAGAEGINLQFCSLIINYDLPWNPQRVEQRIGRCHRYGQKHDVVVVNFINKKNAADRRVYELLSEKFQLFEGVFGASDEVLGAIGSGVDFEKRIASIYQDCRDSQQIQQAFDELQLELKLEIDEALTTTREKLLEHFDDEVREKLRIRDNSSKQALSNYEKQLVNLTKLELAQHIRPIDDASFQLQSLPSDVPSDLSTQAPLGLYELPRRSGNAHLYRHSHPLAQYIIERAMQRDLPTAELHFSYSQHQGNISALQPYLGTSGWLSVSQFSIDSLGQQEDYLIHTLITDAGEILSQDIAKRLLTLPITQCTDILEPVPPTLDTELLKQQKRIHLDVSERNANFFEKETTKLDHWADDLKLGLESEIKEIDATIREARKTSSLATALEDKVAAQKRLKKLETQRKEKRRSLFDAQDDIDEQRDELITNIETKLGASATSTPIFTIRFKLI